MENQIFKNLSDTHYLNANYQEATAWYAKHLKWDADIPADYMYRYAQTVKSNGEYKEFQAWMQKFEASTINDLSTRKFADNSDYLKEMERLSVC